VDENLGLFGWPMPEPRSTSGRPEHVPTDENRNKVMLLLALKYQNADIAKALGLSQPTLRKHYLQQLDQRKVARLQLDATRFAKLYEKVLAGDVGAMKELGKVLDRHDLAELDAVVRGRSGEAAVKADKLGKKETKRLAAGEIGGLYAPPAAPKLN
jgi:predicted ArsR family transcriptional regulator